METSTWGWLKYKRLRWSDDKGHRWFEAEFTRDNDPDHWTIQRIRFWATRPIKALIIICQSGKEPRQFHDKVIN